MENKEIRRLNMIALAVKFKTLEALAKATDSNQYHLSQIKNGTRGMGPKVARRFEKKLERQRGWMDALHTDPMVVTDPLESQLMKLYRGVTSVEARERILGNAHRVFIEEHPEKSVANPYGEKVSTK